MNENVDQHRKERGLSMLTKFKSLRITEPQSSLLFILINY